MNIDTLLKNSAASGASDLHLSVTEPPILRIDGDLTRQESEVLTQETLENMLFEIMTDEQKKHYQSEKEVDFSYELKNIARFRINVYHTRHGIAAAFRTIPLTTPTLEELGLPDIFKKLCGFKNGIVLITGPTGSGKSTTLAAMINYINNNPDRKEHIITIEDPIEFVYQNKNCLIDQREVGSDTKSFNNALRSALREDPDVILVGELRDLETIELALTAAETGHLIFATLHTNSAAKAIDRITGVFSGAEAEMVRTIFSESLRGVVAQTLLKKPEGGRVAAHEILINTPAIKNLIREQKVAQIYSAIQTGAQHGMVTMEQQIQTLVQNGQAFQP